MNVRSLFALAAVIGLISAAVPALAHHSFAAEFDRAKPVTIIITSTPRMTRVPSTIGILNFPVLMD